MTSVPKMINKFFIENFKCISHADLDLKPITLLTGLNGMGKSTVLQSLLLLQQTFEHCRDGSFSTLILNGEYINIGNAKDALWEGSKDDSLTFGFTVNDQKIRWKFEHIESDGDLKTTEQKVSDIPIGYGLFSDDFHYIRAERFGPRTSFPISNTNVRQHNKIGVDGEFAPFFLSTYGTNKLLNKHLHHPNASSAQLKHQVEAWLGEISPGTRIYTQTHSDLDLVSLAFSFISTTGETEHFRSINVGFGITYIMPIVLRILSAKPDSMILLENPEAHLHPKGQVKMGELLGLATKGGVQILVETHSDHLLNGIRLAVHEGKLNHEDVGIFFFDRQEEEGSISAKILEPKINENGRIDHWPDGFFDESEKILQKLLVPSSQSND